MVKLKRNCGEAHFHCLKKISNKLSLVFNTKVQKASWGLANYTVQCKDILYVKWEKKVSQAFSENFYNNKICIWSLFDKVVEPSDRKKKRKEKFDQENV